MYRKLGQLKPLYESIVSEIEQMVLVGDLKPGDVLPPERELAQRFGVSRTAIREATKVLSEKHLVVIVRGKGVVVAKPTPTTVSASLGLLLRVGGATLAQLTEMRKTFEPDLAALAALRATTEQVRRLEELATAYEASADQPTRAVSQDVAFHRAISDAAGNAVAKAIVDSIHELYFESMMHDYRVEGALQRAIVSHRQICSAIRRRDSEGARQHMREHLDNVLRDQLLAARQPGEDEGGISPRLDVKRPTVEEPL